MSKHKKHEEHVNHERWLVSYADFITLLFAFFVIMYAVSEVDKNKLKKFSNSVQFAFHHVGTGGTNTKGRAADSVKPKVMGNAFPKGRRTSDPGPFESLTAVVQFLDGSILKWFERLERDDVQRIVEDRGVVVRIPAERLFSPSSAMLRPDRSGFFREFGEAVERFNVSFRVAVYLDVLAGEDSWSEYDLALRRQSALVRAIRRASKDWRARIETFGELREVADIETSQGEKSRAVFEFYLSP
ncbi:MAG: hypothetical protein HY812_12695 [Planctomycetes bacterium]|nr:hypothetical protein [Planctomycetota bacterium]